jgi:predicted nucleic acid-binding protein
MVFLDTSALVKVYVQERGSEVVRDLVGRRATLVSGMTYVEARAAFARRKREGVVDADALEDARRFFESHWTRLGVILLTPGLLRDAADLCDRHPLRAGDAIQLASALCARREGLPVLFVGSDRRLLDAAGTEALEVLDPEA